MAAAPPRPLVQRHILLAFFVLTYAVSWGAFSLWDPADDDSIPWFTYGPFLAALILTAVAGGWLEVKSLLRRLVQWRVGARWYAIVFGIPVVLALGAVGLTTLSGVATPTAEQWARWPSLFVMFPIRLFFSGPFGEELGWRGFALPRLQQRYSPLIASLILGGLSVVWHLPLFVVGNIRWPDGVLILAAYVVFTWIYNRTDGSVLLCLLFHGVVNTTGGGFIAPMYTGAASVQWSMWLAAVWTVAALILLLSVGTTLGRPQPSQSASFKPAPVPPPEGGE